MGKRKYDATYKLGKTIVHIIAPPPMIEEEKEKILHDFHMAGWVIIDKLIEQGKWKEGIHYEKQKK